MAVPSKCISVADARQLQDNWVDTRAEDIEEAMGVVDTREFNFSVAELEEFIAYVKAESSDAGIDNPGIRIYFAAYNNSKSTKATVFLAPTKGGEVSADNNYDIQPFNYGTGGWPPRNY